MGHGRAPDLLSCAPMPASRPRPQRLRLIKSLERVVAHGHPWIYREALAPFEAEPGDPVEVHDRRGKFLAAGWAEAGPIGVRLLTTQRVSLDLPFLEMRLAQALGLRDRLAPTWGATDAYRLVHGEGDGLPGFVCDRYGRHAVLKLDGEAAGSRWATLAPVFEAELRKRGVEHLLLRRGRGADKSTTAVFGQLPEAPVPFEEQGMKMLADLRQGQKTGMFLDHRVSRLRVRELATRGRVLNLFAYTGGFSLAAALGGASEVTSVDVAAPALALAEQAWPLNGLEPSCHRVMACKVESAFEQFAAAGERFDLVVSDPPNFAPNQKSQAGALKAYKALHRACLDHVVDGGFWLAASCSSHVDRPSFEATLRESAHAARKRLVVLGRWGAGADHPVPIGFPEGEYLTVVLARVYGH